VRCLTDVTSPEEVDPSELRQFMKPYGKVLFFSPLEEYQSLNDNTKNEVVPDWVQWVRMEGGESFENRYKTKGILFIKKGELTNIANQAEAERKIISFFRFDWIGLGTTHHGIDVLKPYQSPIWQTWDVPTIAIWNHRAIGPALFFANAGDWRYRSQPTAWPCPHGS
jgi:hypothetical protein